MRSQGPVPVTIAISRVRPPYQATVRRGREWLALHTRAAHGAGQARWGRLIQGSLTITRADHRAVSRGP
jgi:hypothetical protein